MFKNYMAISIRNLLKHKGYSVINILGHAIGMSLPRQRIFCTESRLRLQHRDSTIVFIRIFCSERVSIPMNSSVNSRSSSRNTRVNNSGHSVSRPNPFSNLSSISTCSRISMWKLAPTAISCMFTYFHP